MHFSSNYNFFTKKVLTFSRIQMFIKLIINEIISRIVDGSLFIEYKKEYGKTIICGTARIGGFNIGIVANQRMNVKTKLNEIQMGGVIYSDSADNGLSPFSKYFS